MQFKVISPNVESTGSAGTDPQAQIEQMLSGNPVFFIYEGYPGTLLSVVFPESHKYFKFMESPF